MALRLFRRGNLVERTQINEARIKSNVDLWRCRKGGNWINACSRSAQMPSGLLHHYHFAPYNTVSINASVRKSTRDSAFLSNLTPLKPELCAPSAPGRSRSGSAMLRQPSMPSHQKTGFLRFAQENWLEMQSISLTCLSTCPAGACRF